MLLDNHKVLLAPFHHKPTLKITWLLVIYKLRAYTLISRSSFECEAVIYDHKLGSHWKFLILNINFAEKCLKQRSSQMKWTSWRSWSKECVDFLKQRTSMLYLYICTYLMNVYADFDFFLQLFLLYLPHWFILCFCQIVLYCCILV